MSNVTIRNVFCDFYMEKSNAFSKQVAEFANRMPIIRIFGILDSGQKCCVHVHGVFPYFLLGFDTCISQQIVSELHSVIDGLLEGPDFDYNKEQGPLYKVETIIAKSIYGYHKDNEEFIKVSFFSPYHRNKVIHALQQGSFSKSMFQLYEAHVPYILQFFIDYSLFGMDLVHFKSIKYRVSPQANTSDFYALNLTVGEIINNTSLLSPLLPTTTVAVECDAFASDIANRNQFIGDRLSNPGLSYIWKDEELRCNLKGISVPNGLSQDQRTSVINDVENEWLKQLKEIATSLKTLVKADCTMSTSKLDSTFFDDTFSFSMFSSAKEPSKQASSNCSDDYEEELRPANEDDPYDLLDEQEDDETKEMSQVLLTLCNPSRINEKHSEDAANKRIDNNLGLEQVLDHALSNDMTGCNSEIGTPLDFVDSRKELLRLSPDLFEDDEDSSNSSTNSGFERMVTDIEDANTSFHKNCKRASSSSENPNNGPPIKALKRSEGINTPKQRQKILEIGDKMHKNDNRNNQGMDINVNSLPTRCSYGNSNFSKNLSVRSGFREIVKRYRSYKRLDDGTWLTPSYLLPLRQPMDDINLSSENTQVFSEDLKSVLTQNLTQQSSKKDFLDSLSAESWCEPSFFDYSVNKEKPGAATGITELSAFDSNKTEVDIRNLCVLSMETLCFVQENQQVPDPKKDAILGIFCCVSVDVCVDNCPMETVCFLNCKNGDFLIMDARLYYFSTEEELLDAFVVYLKKIDPDIVLGYSTLKNSWGYLVERSITLGRNILSEISRYKVETREYWNPEQPNFYFDPRPRGRILMNVWKFLRYEMPLRSYALSNVVRAVLGKRFPEFSEYTLCKWMISKSVDVIETALRYKLLAAKLNLLILCRLNFFTRVAEMARLYGIQFNEVLSRGSQFRVESMLLRLARLRRLVAATVSPSQRNSMPSPETIPLIMEPKSGFYRDPVVVLDFQSLYPSVIIAYNYCFSTCLGRVSNIRAVANSNNIEHIRIGALNYSIPVHDMLKMLKNHELHISPVGGIFCKKSVLKGVTPILLEGILDTRVMVKNAIKMYNDNPRLQKILDARQLALKLIANVTYGYSAANFSGRMPCVEVADAIGREALENAVALVNSGAYGSARVIYGDTDSLFVLCPGSSREEAFQIGKRIADDITLANPSPMKLKLEKIMHPLILESKKRYVGISYEKSDTKQGKFDAKGIETVRRDSCPLVAKILEDSLNLAFNNHFSTLVRYLDVQLSNLDRFPLTDFIFSREYRRHYSDRAVVPAKTIAKRRRSLDPRNEPEVGERLSYLVVAGPPDARLITCIREPWEFMRDSHLYINYDYYVHRQVLPALHRAFGTLPFRFTWHRPISGDCYGCKAVGVNSWCAKCGNEFQPLCSALCDFFLERRDWSKLNRACANCIAVRSIYGDFSYCENLSCAVATRRIQLSRSRVADALRLHNLSDSTIKLLL